MALLSMGGTSMVERCGRASTRLVASSVGISSTSGPGLACASSWASASSTDISAWRALPAPPCSLVIDSYVSQDKFGDGCVVVEVQARQPGLDRRVGGERHDVRVVRMKKRLARFLAPHLELRDGRELEALDEQEVARRDAADLLFERRLLGASQLVHEHPAPRGGDEDFGGARLAVPVRVLARNVDVEVVVRVLDQRDAEAAPDEARDQLLDQRGLAASRPACE